MTGPRGATGAPDERLQHELEALDGLEAMEALQAFPPEDRSRVLLELPPAKAADLLEALPDDLAADAVVRMPPRAAALIVQEMQSDEEVDLLQDIPPRKRDSILELVDRDDANNARRLLEYAEDTAGGLMQSELIAISRDMNAAEVVAHLRENASEYADYPAAYIYVTDEANRLEGVVSVRAVLLCDAMTGINAIANDDVLSVPVTTSGAEMVRLFGGYRYLAIPVVDDEGVLVGVVTQDDALRLAQEEREEELLSLTGIVGGEEFRSMPLWKRASRRLSWLSVNIVLNIMAASVIAFHQDTVQAVIALAVFLPIISDMSGCSGNQAVAVSIRELALDRIQPRDYLRVVGKEAAVGIINGLALGVLLGVAAVAWKRELALGAVIGGALWINTLVAVAIGGVVPLLLRSLRQDPALASGPVLTTLTDMCGFLIVLTLASRFLHLLT